MSRCDINLYMLIDWLLAPGSDATNPVLHYAVGLLAFGACCVAGWYCGDWLFDCLKSRKE
ncbi:hypothetical protein [Paraburkholderia megapolitana]|uniref:hypothetical protein n=1 Tax=Paraburkholderia megapolitana TaxID=420953 RepID=UPI0038B9BC0D